MKIIYIVPLLLFLTIKSYSQEKKIVDTIYVDTIYVDTTYPAKAGYRTLQKVNINKSDSLTKKQKIRFKNKSKKLYRPTRLGSSSPLYDTYRENDYGAGSVTTNPNKGGKSFIDYSPTTVTDSLKLLPKDSSLLRNVKDSIPSKNK